MGEFLREYPFMIIPFFIVCVVATMFFMSGLIGLQLWLFKWKITIGQLKSHTGIEHSYGHGHISFQLRRGEFIADYPYELSELEGFRKGYNHNGVAIIQMHFQGHWDDMDYTCIIKEKKIDKLVKVFNEAITPYKKQCEINQQKRILMEDSYGAE